MIGQSGGPTAAINATLAGIIKGAREANMDHIYGMIHGIKGLIHNNYIDLSTIFIDDKDLDSLQYTPAMYLGSCRFQLPTYEEDSALYTTIFTTLDTLEITDFYYIGGNDSMDTVMKLSAYAKHINSDIRFIGVPKTIDNDLAGMDHTPGFGSAAKYVATSTLEIIHDSLIYEAPSVTIIEIMGRNAGWLTAAAGLARTPYNDAPDLIYLPEVPFNITNFLKDIHTVFQYKQQVIVAVSEGIKDASGHFLDDDSKYVKKDVFGHVLHSGTGKKLESIVYQEFHCKVRSIELNVLQRCAMHIASKTDIMESFQIGQEAVVASLHGETGKVLGLQRISNEPYRCKCMTSDVTEVANIERKIPLDWIHPDKNNITPTLHKYLLPLIQGEVALSYENGIPSYTFNECMIKKNDS